jgi:hypothetical protein
MSDVIETKAEETAVKKMQLSYEKNGKSYFLVFDEGSSIGEVYDGCYSILAAIVKLAQDNVEKAAPQHVE